MNCQFCGAVMEPDSEGIPAHPTPVCGKFIAQGNGPDPRCKACASSGDSTPLDGEVPCWRCAGTGLAFPGRCWDCGTAYRIGDGYGEMQAFCSEACADSFKHELGA